MTLDARSATIVQLVSRFKQLSSAHIQTLVFNDQKSRTPCDRALHRLVDRHYLIRIERRMVGGAKGGSGLYVYALGRRGHYLHFDGKYSPARAVNYHSIAVADAYIELKRLERSAQLGIVGNSTEPDCWVTVGGVELRPDMYVELELPRGRGKAWLEVDMGTEGQKQLRTKLNDYWRAYNGYDGEWPWHTFWVCVDNERVKEIRWLLSEGEPEAQALFSVCTLNDLSTSLGV